MYSNVIRLFHNHIALRVYTGLVIACLPTILLYAQNTTSENPSEYSPSCSTGPAAHRLFYSPTSNAQPGAVFYAEAGYQHYFADETFLTPGGYIFRAALLL